MRTIKTEADRRKFMADIHNYELAINASKAKMEFGMKANAKAKTRRGTRSTRLTLKVSKTLAQTASPVKLSKSPGTEKFKFLATSSPGSSIDNEEHCQWLSIPEISKISSDNELGLTDVDIAVNFLPYDTKLPVMVAENVSQAFFMYSVLEKLIQPYGKKLHMVEV